MKFNHLRNIFMACAVAATGIMTGCTGLHEQQGTKPEPVKTDTVATEKPFSITDSVQAFPPFIERLVWMSRQTDIMKDTAVARQFNSFLKQFDKYKNKPLYQQALAVDGIVDAHLTWVDDSLNYNGNLEYFASAAQTYLKGSGDCDEYASLKYEVMKYLGVDPDRYFMLLVASKGDGKLDHAVLGVDTSKAKDKSGTVVLDNMYESVEKRGRAPSVWKTAYTPMYLINGKGNFEITIK